jgi:endonuclease YncB( thermonuclease family)
MKKIYCAIIALLLLGGSSAAEDSVTGEAQIRDAVTIAIAGARFRLAGLAAAENQSCGGRLCAEVAAAVIGARLAGQQVTCAKERRLGHGYFLARCMLTEGPDLGLLILEEGFALPETTAPANYKDAAERAKSAARGLWSR